MHPTPASSLGWDALQRSPPAPLDQLWAASIQEARAQHGVPLRFGDPHTVLRLLTLPQPLTGPEPLQCPQASCCLPRCPGT